jgi:hypothetical protein
LPFTVSATADMTFLLEIRPKTSFFAPTGETGGGSGQNRVDNDIFCSASGLRWQPGQKLLSGNKDFSPEWQTCRAHRPEVKARRGGKPAPG